MHRVLSIGSRGPSAFGHLVLGCSLLACVPPSDAAQPAAMHDADPLAEPTARPELPAAVTAPPARAPWPPTSLELSLLATLAAPTGGDTRATVRDKSSGVIATYRVGDAIREGVEVLAIESGVVELSNAGEVEYLTISPEPVELAADDVFYPDLLDELGLAHDMSEAVQMPEGLEYVVKSPSTAWGTPRTVGLLRDAIRDYARSVRGEPKVHIGDLSLRTGGPFAPHLSHQDGRDVDIGYVIAGPNADDRRFIAAHAGNLDLERTYALVSAVLATGAVKYVFMDYDVQAMLYRHALQAGEDPGAVAMLFQYPRGRRTSHGTIRHWKGHRNHFHVRFAE